MAQYLKNLEFCLLAPNFSLYSCDWIININGINDIISSNEK